MSGAPVPLAAAAQVNPNTTNTQFYLSVATDAAGDYVVAWQSHGQAPSTYRIYAQRYNASGNAQGSEFQVNEFISTTQGQGEPAVAMDAAGDFVIVWNGFGNKGGGTYVRRYNSSGVAEGTEYEVGTESQDRYSWNPSIAMDAVGDFVITWNLDLPERTVGQRYNSAGVAQGDEFQVNTGTTNDVDASSVAMDAVGDFVIAWGGYGPDGSRTGIYAQRYNPAGVPQGSEFLVNTSTTGSRAHLSASMDAAGDFVIAWDSTQQSSDSDIYARRYNAAGVPLGSEFHVNPSTTFIQRSPSVAMDAAGDFVVSWRSYDPASLANSGIVGQLYTAVGVAQGGNILVIPYTSDSWQPDVAMDAAGDFVVAWSGAFYYNKVYGDNIFARRYQANLTSKPTVILPTSANITATSASLGGDVTLAHGAGPIADRGVVYALTSVNPNPRLGGTGVTNATATGTTGVFTAHIAGLTPATGYSFAAYATNGSGTAYTSPVSFTTLPNHAPTGRSRTVTALENSAYVFKVADFGFSDPNDNPPNTLLAVKITTLPAAGTLKDNGTAITAGQFVSAADIAGGKLAFTPVTHANGVDYASFGFRVQDNGGTAGGGVNIDPNTKTMTINVTRVNQAPAGTAGTVTTGENIEYTFKTSDFGFTDPNDHPPNTLLAVKMVLLPTAGVLTDNGTAVTLNHFVSAADISNGKLVFTPKTDLLGSPLFLCKFQVQDNGGTANGGVNLDPNPKVLDVNIVKVNHAPSGTSGTVTAGENTAYVLKASDFGFTDPNDNPPNRLLAVKFTLLPAAGTLTDNGVTVTVNQFVSAADIGGGKLVFRPKTNLTGGPYFLCKFQVQDDGGAANGGVNLDPSPKILVVKLT